MKKNQSLRVLVVTPLGEGGQGGIDRLMDEMRPYLSNDKMPHIHTEFVVTRGQGHLLLFPFLVLRLLLRLTLKLCGQGPDLLHINLSSHGSTWRKLVIAGFAQMLRIPYIIHLHGSGFREYFDGAGPFLSNRIKSLFLNADQILVLGTVWRDYIITKVPNAAQQIVILPNAVPNASDRVNTLSSQVNILFLGAIGPRKGVPELVDALALLPKDKSWKAIIAGNGELDKTHADVIRLGLKDHVTLPGWVSSKDVQKLLKDADILVLPSYEENLPMSVIEGMAHGLAVITTPVGAVKDIIQTDITGILVPVGDVTALSHALQRFISNSDLRANMGKAAQVFQREHLETEGYIYSLLKIWLNTAKKHKFTEK
jgi:glycosyltransferase involved in cell wall biosynthesis